MFRTNPSIGWPIKNKQQSLGVCPITTPLTDENTCFLELDTGMLLRYSTNFVVAPSSISTQYALVFTVSG